MRVPAKFPAGAEFFELESGTLAVVLEGKAFLLFSGELKPARAWPPLAEAMPLSERVWRAKAAAEAAE